MITHPEWLMQSWEKLLWQQKTVGDRSEFGDSGISVNKRQNRRNPDGRENDCPFRERKVDVFLIDFDDPVAGGNDKQAVQRRPQHAGHPLTGQSQQQRKHLEGQNVAHTVIPVDVHGYMADKPRHFAPHMCAEPAEK